MLAGCRQANRQQLSQHKPHHHALQLVRCGDLPGIVRRGTARPGAQRGAPPRVLLLSALCLRNGSRPAAPLQAGRHAGWPRQVNQSNSAFNKKSLTRFAAWAHQRRAQRGRAFGWLGCHCCCCRRCGCCCSCLGWLQTKELALLWGQCLQTLGAGSPRLGQPQETLSADQAQQACQYVEQGPCRSHDCIPSQLVHE